LLAYEHERTADIASRLLRIANMIRLTTIASYVIVAAAIASAIGFAALQESWWIAAGAGAVVGYVLGAFTASLLTTAVEWMAQLLVAQGEILAATKRRQ
jgi:hypothetical protein